MVSRLGTRRLCRPQAPDTEHGWLGQAQAFTQIGQRTSSLPVGIKQRRRRKAGLRGQGSGEKASLVWQPSWLSVCVCVCVWVAVSFKVNPSELRMGYEKQERERKD